MDNEVSALWERITCIINLLRKMKNYEYHLSGLKNIVYNFVFGLEHSECFHIYIYIYIYMDVNGAGII